MNFEYGSQDKSGRIKGVLIVIAIHALLVYAVASGLTRKGIDLIKIPLEMVMVKELAPPPPMPPP
ncbi:energy transducer TonB, partial [Roseateles sp. GG27B]